MTDDELIIEEEQIKDKQNNLRRNISNKMNKQELERLEIRLNEVIAEREKRKI